MIPRDEREGVDMVQELFRLYQEGGDFAEFYHYLSTKSKEIFSESLEKQSLKSFGGVLVALEGGKRQWSCRPESGYLITDSATSHWLSHWVSHWLGHLRLNRRLSHIRLSRRLGHLLLVSIATSLPPSRSHFLHRSHVYIEALRAIFNRQSPQYFLMIGARTSDRQMRTI